MSEAHRTREWLRRALSCGALLAAAALAVPAQTAHAAPDDPSPAPYPGGPGAPPYPVDGTAADSSQESLQALLDRLQSLYHKAEEATEDYNAAKEKLGKQRKAVKDLDRKLDHQREEVRRGHRDAGALARRQYMDGGLSDYSKLLLSDDPHHALQRGHMLGQTAKNQASTVRRLEAEERRLTRLSKEKKKAVGKAAEAARKQRAARDRVTKQLDRVEKIVSTLTGAQLDEMQALEERGFNALQEEFLRSGALGKGGSAPSAAGRRAIAYAFNQLGDPYVWGAEGPDAFDCSGLTSQAWLHAGRAIPRTSQEQWRQLPRVPLNRMRPGDLVIYFPGATHVGMYIGQGLIVQAPRPGAQVKVSPVGSMPVLGAVRPDPEARSLGDYQPPRIPDSARKPAPIGGSTERTQRKDAPERRRASDTSDADRHGDGTADDSGEEPSVTERTVTEIEGAVTSPGGDGTD